MEARQMVLLPELFPDAANDDVAKRKRRAADEGGDVDWRVARIAALEKELEMEREAGIVLEMALADVADPDEFVPEVHHQGPSVARCRGWHRGHCPHACGQQFLAARKHAAARLAEARLIRRRHVEGGGQ